MFLVRILFLLLPHAAFSNNTWHVYVDFEVFKVTELQRDATNMISAILQTEDADISCPRITQAAQTTHNTADKKTFNSPCAYLESAASVTYDPLSDYIWTIACPDVLWIELSVIRLELPLSGPKCTEGHVAFQNLIGEPQDVMYCGRKPRQILYASPKLTIIQHIQRLRSELRMNLEYQYISKQFWTHHQRMPYILGGYTDTHHDEIPHVLLVTIPYHRLGMTGIVQYQILCIPNNLHKDKLRVVIHAGECNYAVHDGPGINSPFIGNSSTLGTLYSVQSAHPMYIEFWGSMEVCQPVKLEYLHLRSLPSFYTDIILQGEYNEPIQCSNASYRLVDAFAEFHVQSSEKRNVWCRLYNKFHRFNHINHWNYILEMEFNGPNNLFQDIGNSCQFGGVYFHAREHSQAFCETLSIKHNNYNTRSITTIYIRFYTGYSAGSVMFRVFKTAVAPRSFNFDNGWCTTADCAGNNIHVWDENYVEFSEDGSVAEKTKYLFFDAYPKQFNYLIKEPLDRKYLHVHITAGNADGTIMLGLVHFVVSLQCSVHTVCATQCVIGTSILSTNFAREEYIYEGSVAIDEHVGDARMISLSINISNVDEVQLRVLFEKVQFCDHNSPDQYARQLAYNDCDFIKVKNGLGYANLVTQPMQTLTIRLDPACPVKKCIDFNVKATPLCACSAPFEWKNTALEHVPITVNTSFAYTSLSWAQSPQCSADFHSEQHLCDIWINVDVRALIMDGIMKEMVNHNDYFTVPLSSNTHQLYLYKM